MNDGVFAKIEGLPDLREALSGLVPKLRVRALRNALTAGARIVQRAARAATPVLKLSTRSGQAAYRKGYRRPGTVKKAISVRLSKQARREGNVGVFVNVRPAKGGSRGAKNYRDPFYWRWINFGWNPRGPGGGASAARAHRKLAQRGGPTAKPGAEFLQAGARMLGAAMAEFVKRIGPAIAKLNQPKAPAP